MKQFRLGPLLVVLFLLFLSIAPKAAMAVDLIVNNTASASSCAYPACFPSIQQAIVYADSLVNVPTPTTTNFRVLVEPGTYTEKIILKSNIPLLGRETARTILSGGGTGPVVTASAVTGVNFKNFTIATASLGMSVSNSTIVIENNVFQVGTAGTAVQIQGSPAAQVVNNTFYLNGTALTRDADSIIVKNNIFLNNTTNINQGAVASQNNIFYNAFLPVTTVGPQGTNFIPNTLITQTDPLFVDVANSDFHLKAGSPCIDNGDPSITDSMDGTRSDIGAYGGPDADAIPFQVSGVTSAQPSTTSVTLNWTPNTWYLTGGYKIYYGNASGTYTGTGATEGSSPITVPTGSATSFTLTGLTISATTPASPTLNPPAPLNESLALSWNTVAGATGYKVYYGTVSPPTTAVDVGPNTSYTLPGLTNGQTYYVAVSAYSQSLLYLAVTALDSTNGPFEAGLQHESEYSQEVTAGTGDLKESSLSNVLSDFPEAIVPYPNLPNGHKGCFIATAAYGYYSAPSVQMLRRFRDQYLLTNAAGVAFVEWYYRVSPAAAEYLNAHPAYKPLVRAALLPALGMSLFLLKTSLAMKIAFLLLTGCFLGVLLYRKRFSGVGGPR